MSGDCYGVLGDANICANHPGGKMTSAGVCTAKYENASLERTKATEVDIVARLRDNGGGCPAGILCVEQREEAADEIAALRASNEIIRQASEKYNSEIERLRAFRNRIVGFFNELHEDAKDEHGCRIPYMLFGADADVLERFEKVIGEDRNG